MRSAAKRIPLTVCSLLLLLSSTTGYVRGQTLPTFQHIVIVFQENRTPGNLFGSGGKGATSACGVEDPFEPGVDIQNGGQAKGIGAICFTARAIDDSCDPGHFHGDFENMWDNDHLDGCGAQSTCPSNGCYSDVPQSDVQPYFDIATNYGFANYMFQTNEGPSFQAHQFIFSGTSGPIGTPPTMYYNYFGVDNPPSAFDSNTGCSGSDSSNDSVGGIDPNGKTHNPWYIPPGLNFSYPCYTHNTLIDLLTPPKISWKYYAPDENSIWTAPTAFSNVCGGIDVHPCPNFHGTGKYVNNVILESENNLTPIFTDIVNCNLAQVSWVIPDGRWSDHPGLTTKGGPSYVSDLVDLIGISNCKDPNGHPYWDNTAIFITWDDWGGWYDHVNPNHAPGLGVKVNCQDWGCGYTYGFRVPLMVVSAYTKAGYVSGNTNTVGETQKYVHDFGSILAFVENNFLGSGEIGKINPQYPFADAFAPDGIQGNIPLSDFFDTANYRTFTYIQPGIAMGTSYFMTFQRDPEGPDD